MEAQLTESSTFPSQAYAKSFFASYPSDARFLQCSYQKIVPSTEIKGQKIEFTLDKFEAANVWMIQDTNLQVTISITKEDGKTLPDKTKNVGPVNNMLHSLWSSVRVIINDVPISVTPGNYPYKSYITNCLTYASPEKSSHLETQGWVSDTSGYFSPTTTNIGWKERVAAFRKGFKIGTTGNETEYRSGGYTLIGRLMTDLVSCETGIPPHNKIKIELDRSPDSFYLMCDAADTEKYKINLSNICLYIPVAQLSSSVFSEINTLLANPKEPKSVTIHYRKLEVKEVTIPRNKNDFLTDSLFPDSDLPCKIIVCFVEADAKIGDYHKNPYEFRRSWEVEVDDVQSELKTNPVETGRLNNLECKFDNLSQKFDQLINVLSASQTQPKSKGSSQKTKNQKGKQTAGKSQEDINHHDFENMFGYEQATGPTAGPSFSRTPSIFTEDGSACCGRGSEPEVQAKTKKTFYLTQVQCLLNSQPLDQIDDMQTEEECITAYWRLFTANGQMNSLFTNSISYEQFRLVLLIAFLS
jgi:hypothetical protein